MHSGNGPHEEMDRRAIACFDQALRDVGLAGDDRLRQVLHDYFAWATTTTMSRYHAPPTTSRTAWASRTGHGTGSSARAGLTPPERGGRCYEAAIASISRSHRSAKMPAITRRPAPPGRSRRGRGARWPDQSDRASRGEHLDRPNGHHRRATRLVAAAARCQTTPFCEEKVRRCRPHRSIASPVMGTVGWADLEVRADAEPAGAVHGEIAERWMLVVVPQGGAVAVLAARAMAAELAVPEQTLRTFSAVFAGQVAVGPVEIDVTVLRRGRSMSQLTATVRNPGADAGLTAIAVFGEPRRGFAFTELEPPTCPGPRASGRTATPSPKGSSSSSPAHRCPCGRRSSTPARRAAGPPGSPSRTGRRSSATGTASRTHRCSTTVASTRSAPSSSATPCPAPWARSSTPTRACGSAPAPTSPSTSSAPPGPAGCSATTGPARPATATPRSRWPCGTRSDWSLVAYATQVMFFAFGR